MPDERGIAPSYEQRRSLPPKTVHCVSLTRRSSGLGYVHADAALYAGLLDGPEAVTQPLSPTRKTDVHLVRGALWVNGQPLAAGDAALLENESSLALTDAQDAEVLVFDLAA